MATGDGKFVRLARFVALTSVFCVASGCAAVILAGSDANAPKSATLLRLGVSENVVVGVNLNDAKAALAIWSEELLKTIDIRMELAPNQEWVMPSDQLLSTIRAGQVDLICLTVQEYRQVAPYIDTRRVITDNYGGDEFVLVVRQGSGIDNLAGLRGKSLILWDSPGTSLADPWLSVELWKEGPDSPRQVLGRITKNTKLAQVVLPVFFGQADACLVTRRGLDTMIELNPQLAQKLKVLVTSPQMEGTFFACRKDYPENLKKQILDGLVGLESSPPAKQISTMFQSPGFALRDADGLRPAITLLDAYERHHQPSGERRK
jgi:phosphonate transport system substrate-binding protein